MSVVDQGRVGDLVAADGTIQPFSESRFGALKTTDRHGRYMEAVYRGNVYTAATQSGQVIAAISATATGFTLTNPAGSQTALALLDLEINLTTSGVTTPNSIALVAVNSGSVVQTTAITVRNAIIGNTRVGVGLAAYSATLPSVPFVLRVYPGGVLSSGAGALVAPDFIKDDIAGAIMLAPGSAVAVEGLPNAANGTVSCTWEEIPYP